MRKINKLIGIGLFSVCLLLASGCNESDPPKISVSPSRIETNYEANSIEIELRANGAWSGRSDAAWCRLSKSSGNGSHTVAVIVEENPDATDRTAHVLFTTGNEETATSAVLVIQKGEDVWND